MTKTYTLELTAEEVGVLFLHRDERVPKVLPERDVAFTSALAKLRAARDQVEADREADELRLPWRAEPVGEAGSWKPRRHGPCVGGAEIFMNERAAKLMSAAPELLEAVQAVNGLVRERGDLSPRECRFIDRALRKVSTGVPEES